MPVPGAARPRVRSRHARRSILAAAAAGAGVLVLAGPASAHVTVSSDDSARGAADAVLTFRVPNEDAAATTTKIDIKFPVKTPLASVLPGVKPGWTVSTKTVRFDPPIKTDDGTISEGVGEVIYTATDPGQGIPAGGFEAFQVLVGPLPDAPSLAFPTVQTYSNGTTVRWIQPVTDPKNAPDNPTPMLQLAPRGNPGEAAAPSPAAPPAAGSPAATVAADPADLSGYATTSQVTTATTLGIVGIVVGALGLGVGALGLPRARRATTPVPESPEGPKILRA